jgi:tetratricopeptide (TPR) repeat protein
VSRGEETEERGGFEGAARGWRSDPGIALLVFILALALRLFHLREIAIHDPFFTIPSVDGAVYDQWARTILAGEGLGDGVLFLGPLYPLFLALVYALFGVTLGGLKAIQAGLGALVCVLVWGIAREAFEDRRIAGLSGLLAAFYEMSIFYGGTLMVVNLQLPLVLGFVWAWMRAMRKWSGARWALVGLLLGLSILARQTTLLLAPLVFVAILSGPLLSPGTSTQVESAFSPPLVRRLGFAAIFAGVIAISILPFTIRNYIVADDLVLLNSMGGPNFFMGNQRTADGTWKPPPLGTRVRADNPLEMQRSFRKAAEKETGRAMKSSEISSYWLARGFEEIAADPLRWMRLEARKLGLFFNAYEVWNNRSIEISRRFSWVLRLPLIGFGMIAPLGLLGLWLARRHWRELLPVHATIAVYLASALLFFVLSRYRMPAALLLIPLAASAAIELFDRLRRKEWRTLGLGLMALLALAVMVQLPLTSRSRLYMAWYNVGNKYRELERWDEAIAAYQTSLRENPNAISTHNNLAVAYELGGRREEAIEAWRRVGSLATRSGDRLRMDRARRHLAELGASDEVRSPEE